MVLISRGGESGGGDNNNNNIENNNSSSSSALVAVVNTVRRCENKYFAGDPATMFHELRRFLFSQGVDSKLYSGSRMPSIITSSIGSSSSTTVAGVFNVDNAFFSEFRSMVAVEAAEKRTVVNTLIFTLRVFIHGDGDGSRGTIQMVLNHLHDSIFDLDDMYSALIGFLTERSWEQHQPTCSRLSLTSNMVFERNFAGVHQFTSEYYKLKPILEFHRMVGSHLPIEAPF